MKTQLYITSRYPHLLEEFAERCVAYNGIALDDHHSFSLLQSLYSMLSLATYKSPPDMRSELIRATKVYLYSLAPVVGRMCVVPSFDTRLPFTSYKNYYSLAYVTKYICDEFVSMMREDYTPLRNDAIATRAWLCLEFLIIFCEEHSITKEVFSL